MASENLIKAWESYKSYAEANGISEKVIDYSIQAARTAFLNEGDIVYGFGITSKVKEWVNYMIHKHTGADFDRLEEWSQEHKQAVVLINQYYEALQLEAPHSVDSLSCISRGIEGSRIGFTNPGEIR